MVVMILEVGRLSNKLDLLLFAFHLNLLTVANCPAQILDLTGLLPEDILLMLLNSNPMTFQALHPFVFIFSLLLEPLLGDVVDLTLNLGLGTISSAHVFS